jgi:hypothetical protein
MNEFPRTMVGGVSVSLDFLNRRLPDNELQKTRSKKSLEAA